MVHLLTPGCIGAMATAVAGVVLFALAGYLPTPFPPSISRLIGVWAVLSSSFPLWVASGSWPVTALINGLCLAVIILVHVLQTRKGEEVNVPARTPTAPDMSDLSDNNACGIKK